MLILKSVSRFHGGRREGLREGAFPPSMGKLCFNYTPGLGLGPIDYSEKQQRIGCAANTIGIKRVITPHTLSVLVYQEIKFWESRVEIGRTEQKISPRYSE